MTFASGIEPTRWSAVLLVTIAAAVLTACASGGAEPGELPGLPESEPSISIGDSIAGVGPTEFPGMDMPMPADARSVTVTFACTGGERFSLEIGDSMMLGQAPLSGTCDGESTLSWPIVEKTGPTLSVYLADGVEWEATPEFSTEEFVVDAALTSDCSRFSDVYSALLNADTGYTQYKAFDATEWTSHVDEASADLVSLTSDAQPSLRAALTRLSEAVSDPNRAAGAAVMTEAAQEPLGEIGDVCAVNQTPVIIKAEFGG
jgi:hypothetical protein